MFDTTYTRRHTPPHTHTAKQWSPLHRHDAQRALTYGVEHHRYECDENASATHEHGVGQAFSKRGGRLHSSALYVVTPQRYWHEGTCGWHNRLRACTTNLEQETDHEDDERRLQRGVLEIVGGGTLEGFVHPM